MSQQIKKKFIGSDQIDGSKIKLLEGQSIRGTNSLGEEVDLLKIGSQDKVEVLGQEVALKSELDQENARAVEEELRLEGLISEEEAARITGDADLQANIDAEESARQTADSALQANIDAEESARIVADSALQSNIDAETQSRIEGDSDLDAKIQTEKGRIDAILEASTADSDSFKEIVDLINSVDTENDQAFGSYVLSNDAALNQEITDRTTADTTLQNSISAEVQSRIDGDSALDGRLSPIEGMLEYKHSSFLQDAPAVYADAMKGKEDPSSLKRDGWYYTNDGTPYTNVYGQPGQNKINWYFYYQDGINPDMTLGDFSAYAVMTFDNASESPIMGVYTPATGSGDAGSFYHSRVSYSGLSSTPVVGKKYLVYFGQEPEIHPELPRLELSKSALSSVGDQDPNEIVGFVSFGSNSSATVGAVKFMVESLGVNSPQHKTNIKLKIHHATQEELDALQAQVDALDGNFTTDAELAQAVSDLQSEIDADVLVEKQRAEGEEARIEGKLDQEVSDRQAADTTLQSNIDTEKARIDAILDASDANKDSFKEIVDLINSVDTENDSAFAGYVTSNDAAMELKASIQYVDDSIAAIPSVDLSPIEGRLDVLEAKGYAKGSLVVGAELSYIDLDREYSILLSVSVGRLMVHEDEDFTVSVVDGKTRLTWIGSLVNPSGDEAIETGDKVFYSGAF